MAVSTSRRFTELDGLRGVAALWVVLFHYTFAVKHFWLRNDLSLVSHVTPWTGNLEGLRAVDLFFIISGFVIFMTIESSRSVLDFVASRFSRLYPAFWFSVLATSLVVVAIPLSGQVVTTSQVLANLTMLNLYFGVPGVEGVYWSLSFELGFYVLMALCLISGLTKRIEVLGTIWVLISFFTLKLFPIIGAAIPYRIQALTALPYASLFFAGILFFKVWSLGPSFNRILLITLCFSEYVCFKSFENILIGLGIFLTFSLCIAGRGTLFATRPLVFLGTISYPLYLLHGSIGFRVQMFSYLIRMPPAINLIFSIGIAIALASAVTFAVDKPGQAFIRRMYRTHQIRRASAEQS